MITWAVAFVAMRAEDKDDFLFPLVIAGMLDVTVALAVVFAVLSIILSGGLCPR